MITDEQSDEDIQQQLAGEAYKGPRKWRGRQLADLTRGLRALRNKVVAPEDTAEFHDVSLLTILTDAFGVVDSDKLNNRRRLIIATDDVAGYRATVSILLDELSDAEIAEGRQVTDDILGIVERAEVVIAQKKTDVPASAEPSLTTMPWPSGALPERPASIPNTSAGS